MKDKEIIEFSIPPIGPMLIGVHPSFSIHVIGVGGDDRGREHSMFNHLLTPSRSHLCTNRGDRLLWRNSGNKYSYMLTPSEGYLLLPSGKRLKLNTKYDN